MRFCGKVGYVIQTEKNPGVWVEEIEEHTYRGDVLRNANRMETASRVNGSPMINDVISILADQFSYQNFQWIRYVEFMGAKWEVDTIEVERPRMKLQLGGLYHGEED